MKDRLVPQTYKLDNGLTVHYFPSDAPFITARYVVPFGSGHNTEGITRGSFHFLEHALFHRSKLYPEYKEWSTKVGLVGGSVNASTYRRITSYIVALPIQNVDLLDGFFSMIFEPLLQDEDIAGERGIIKNERKSKERWYPGNDEISNYLWSKWLDEDQDYIFQRLGSDEDLDAINGEYLRALHKEYYYSEKGFILISGAIDPQLIVEKLKDIQTTKTVATYQERTITWADKTYRELGFNDASRHTYHLGGIIPKDYKQNLIARFGLILLINPTHGALYKWLRDEKKWVYSLNIDNDTQYENTVWTMSFPFSQPEHVQEARTLLMERIKQAFSDESLIEAEKNRYLGQQTFRFETPDEIIDYTLGKYSEYGIFVTEAMNTEVIQSITSADLLKFLDQEFGEILITPLEKK